MVKVMGSAGLVKVNGCGSAGDRDASSPARNHSGRPGSGPLGETKAACVMEVIWWVERR